MATTSSTSPPLASWALSRERAHAAIVAVSVAIHLMHQWYYRDWFIDDAAISFAYARNLVEGHGLVAVPGGERIEGFSNPLWVFLLAGFQLVGVDGFTSSKWMVAFFGSACIVLAWRLARAALPDDPGHATVFAPVILGMSAHHAIWSASTLENSLFNFLILGGCLQLLKDAKGGTWPWSALWFFGAGITRPDGILYAAAAGGWFLVFCWRDGRGWRPVARWVALYWIPYGAFLLARLWYFAMPLPNTYYAKFVTQGNFPHKWYARGWEQVREYASRLWQGWFIPLYLVGLLGTRGRRGTLALVTLSVLAVSLLIPGPVTLRNEWFWPFYVDPLPWIRLRIVLIALVMVVLPFAALGSPGGRARILAWTMACIAIWFSVLSNGDWMRGLRWMSFFTCETAVLLSVGIGEAIRWVSRYEGGRQGVLGWTLAAFCVGVQAPPNLEFSRWYRTRVDDFPEMIKRRLTHTQAFADMVFLEERVRPLDMDMGAHLWWGDQRPVDMAGLVDVPISLHTYADRAFIKEYVFQEKKPHFGHVHGQWAKNSGFKTYDEWDRDYFPFVGYIDGPRFHDGQWARRDLVMSPGWEHPIDRTVGFSRGIVLEGFDLPSPEAGSGRALFIHSAWRTKTRRDPSEPFSVTMFLSRQGQVGASWDLPMGYAVFGYPIYPTEWWAPTEVFDGRFAVSLPRDLPSGHWDVGFVVRGPRGHVLRAGGPKGGLPVPEGAVVGGVGEEPAVFAEGEVRFPGLALVVPQGKLMAYADADRIAALEAAWGGSCAQAEERWIHSRRHLPRDKRYKRRHEPELRHALSGCWARHAEQATESQIDWLARAHEWDHHNADLLRVKAPVAKQLYAQGLEARRAEDWEAAYVAFRDLLSFAPEHPWARKYAEEARDHRLATQRQKPRSGDGKP